jgi:beta-glucosidase
MVLLKNDGPLLPLDRARVRTLAVIGAMAGTGNTGDRGSSYVDAPDVVTPLAGLTALAGGGIQVRFDEGTDPAAAAGAARGADAVVVVAGLGPKDEGEWIPPLGIGGDRRSLSLKPPDVALIKAVSAVNPNTVVVIMAGSAVRVEEWKAGAKAILMAFYPGMEGGRAIARLLFGDANPSGKLTVTVPADPSWLPRFTPGAPAIDYGLYHGYTLAEKRASNPPSRSATA